MLDFSFRQFCSALCIHSSPHRITTLVAVASVLKSQEGRCLSLRCFLRTTVTSTAGSLVGISANFGAAPLAAFAQTTLSPEAALTELMDGNRRYVTGSTTAHEHDLEVLHARTAEKQQPFAAVLSCADSRVPVELVFDQTIGHVFVCRIARNSQERIRAGFHPQCQPDRRNMADGMGFLLSDHSGTICTDFEGRSQPPLWQMAQLGSVTSRTRTSCAFR